MIEGPKLNSFCQSVFASVARGQVPEGDREAMNFPQPAESLAISTFEGAEALVERFDGVPGTDFDERSGVVDIPRMEGSVAAAAEGTRHQGEAIQIHQRERGSEATYVRIAPDHIDQVFIKGDLSAAGSRVIVSQVDRASGQGHYVRLSGQEWMLAT